jgi:hypothetical protein
MKFVLLLALVIFGNSNAFAAPDTYKAYCLVILGNPKPGEAPPQGEINLKQGESKDFYIEGGYTFTVSYGEDLGRQGVVNLFMLDKAKNKYKGLTSVIIGKGTEFPEQIDVVVHGFGGLSCFQQ